MVLTEHSDIISLRIGWQKSHHPMGTQQSILYYLLQHPLGFIKDTLCFFTYVYIDIR